MSQNVVFIANITAVVTAGRIGGLDDDIGGAVMYYMK